MATANHISLLLLHEQLDNADWIPSGNLSLLDCISALSGQPRERLLRALPDLQPSGNALKPASLMLVQAGWTPQEACTWCTKAKGVVMPVRHWVPVGTKLCLKHGRWTADRAKQFDIGSLPDVLQAQRRYHRLVLHHGWKAGVLAIREASELGWRWWDNYADEHPWRHRLTVCCGPQWNGYENDPRIVACTYPETVALAELLASPQLRRLPFTGEEADMQRFITEIRIRAAPSYVHDDSDRRHPLVRWMQKEAHRRSFPNPMPAPL
ncbi:hypothetical protein [Streptomyces sp. 2R]|uniref:hypothetical protein n=1 Tax=Streptomyces sp. 2R TaxID=1883452 RepID=UPI00117D2B20|nr:hypothetical protein [Streptomyces sp. 2R]